VRDPLDVRSQLVSAINDVGLANALAKTGAEKEAESLYASAEKSLHEVQAHGEDLQIDYTFASINIHRAEMYLARARRDEARAFAKHGLEQLAKVLKALPEDHGVVTLQQTGSAVLAQTR